MTLAIVWPNKWPKPTSLCIAADSLITNTEGDRWEYSAKIFRVFPTTAHVAYCGHCLPALHSVLQGMQLLNSTNTLAPEDSMAGACLASRADALKNHLHDQIKGLPKKWGTSATLVYAGHDRDNGFHAYTIDLWGGQVEEVLFTAERPYAVFGSGDKYADSILQEAAKKGPLDRRTILRTLVRAIEDVNVKTVGGVPQMVTIGRRICKPVGFNWKIDGRVRSTLFGAPLRFRSDMKKVDFFDRNGNKAAYTERAKVRRVR